MRWEYSSKSRKRLLLHAVLIVVGRFLIECLKTKSKLTTLADHLQPGFQQRLKQIERTSPKTVIFISTWKRPWRRHKYKHKYENFSFFVCVCAATGENEILLRHNTRIFTTRGYVWPHQYAASRLPRALESFPKWRKDWMILLVLVF